MLAKRRGRHRPHRQRCEAYDDDLSRHLNTTFFGWLSFYRFPACEDREFGEELLRLYRHRAADQTISDLHPAILTWAGKE